MEARKGGLRPKAYVLKPFFFRLARAHDVDIRPVAVVGAEEFYPYVKHFRSLAIFKNYI